MLLVDRKIDIVSPLVSNFYYLNMISDIFRIDFEHRDIVLKQGRTIKLNFEDSIFMDYKSLHISKVQTQIEPDFKRFQMSNKAAEFRQSTVPTQNQVTKMDLKKIIRDIPEFNRKVKSYEEQVEISLELTDHSKQNRLP